MAVDPLFGYSMINLYRYHLTNSYLLLLVSYNVVGCSILDPDGPQ